MPLSRFFPLVAMHFAYKLTILKAQILSLFCSFLQVCNCQGFISPPTINQQKILFIHDILNMIFQVQHIFLTNVNSDNKTLILNKKRWLQILNCFKGIKIKTVLFYRARTETCQNSSSSYLILCIKRLTFKYILKIWG